MDAQIPTKPFKAIVRKAGGGVVELVVDRDTEEYPSIGEPVLVESTLKILETTIITDEELAEMLNRCGNDANAVWWRYREDVPRLAAALRAERQNINKLLAAHRAERRESARLTTEVERLRGDVIGPSKTTNKTCPYCGRSWWASK